MDGPRRPWLEAIGLVLVLALAATAFLVSRQPGPSAPTTAPATGPAAPLVTPEAGTGEPVTGGSTERRRRARPQRVGGDLGRGSDLSCVVSTDTSLEVVSFNMHSGFNRSRSRQMLPQIAQELLALRADVYLLQEVDKNRIWSGRVDQAAYLAQQLGMEYAFATNVLRPGDIRYGTAVLSRFPIVATSNTLLPRPGSTQQRGLLRAVLQLPGERVSVYTTHFEHTSQDARLLQARAAAEVIANDPYPAIVGGDMNARPAAPPMATLRTVATDSWLVAGRHAGLTHPSADPRGRIDYLLHRGDLGVNAIETYPSRISDHRAVRASYDLTPGVPDEIELPLDC